MVTNYHQTIQKGLISFGRKWKKVKKVYTGNSRPLPITDVHTKLVVRYQPDVYFIMKNNKKIIFEILDSEQYKQDVIMADVIRSFLLENVYAIIFIHPDKSKEVRQRILEALKTIYSGLIDKGIKPEDLPSSGLSGPLAIEPKELEDKEKISVEKAEVIISSIAYDEKW